MAYCKEGVVWGVAIATHQDRLILGVSDSILHGREQPLLAALPEEPRSPHDITIILYKFMETSCQRLLSNS